MDHLAILDKKRKLRSKILSGEKTIESRWYCTKRDPWDKIKVGEQIYFKDSGEPVSVRALVSEVRQFYLPQTNVLDLLEKYGREIGFVPEDFPEIALRNKCKKYCILISLKEVQEIPPFNINKKGFGMMAAWIVVSDINRIKL